MIGIIDVTLLEKVGILAREDWRFLELFVKFMIDIRGHPIDRITQLLTIHSGMCASGTLHRSINRSG
jgi:hypothetical protein